MPPTVSANGLTLVHAESKGQLVTTDICNTTVGNSVIPIPYVNVAETADVTATASTVYVEGCPVCVETSRIEVSRGDESGDQGGIVSGMREGEATFLAGSPDVFVEGVPVVRAFEQMVSNAENTSPAPLLQDLGKPAMADAFDPVAGEQMLSLTAIEIAGGSQAPLPGELVIDAEDGSWHRVKAFRWAENTGSRWLVKAHELPQGTEFVHLSLLDVDDRHGFVKVPLTIGAKQPVWFEEETDSSNPQAQNGVSEQELQPSALVPVLLRLYSRSPDERQMAGCGFGGWIYLFWEHDGQRYLWREFWLDEHGMSREVNLAYEHGDERRATGQGRAVVVIPYYVAGSPVKLSAVYSPVQWPWARVQAHGGLHHDDPRLTVHSQASASDAEASQAVDEQRLLDIDLSSYPAFTAHDLSGSRNIGGCDEFVNAEPLPGEFGPVREDLLPYAESLLPVIYLDDPLGQARWLAREQELLCCDLAALVASLETGRAPQELIMAAYADVPDEDYEVDQEDADEESGSSRAAELHQAAATIYRLGFIEKEVGLGEVPPDRQLLEKLLAVEERAELRQRIAICRRRRLELLAEERYVSALADYLNNTPRRTFAGIATLTEHCNDLAEPAAAADSHLLSDEQIQADSEDLRLARTLLHALLVHPQQEQLGSERELDNFIRVGGRLLSGPVGLSKTCRGKGVPYSRTSLEQQLNQAPPSLREIEGLVSLAEQRRAIGPVDGLKLLWNLAKTFAAPVSYEHEMLTPMASLYERLDLPGSELIGPLEQQKRLLEPAMLGEQRIDMVQSWLAQVRKRGSGASELAFADQRLEVLASHDEAYSGMVSRDRGHSRLWVLGNPDFAPGQRIAPGQLITELVVRREAPTRLADVAERFTQGPAGQAVRGFLGVLEIINLRSALAEVNGPAGIRQLLNAYIATSNSLNLIIEMAEAYQRRRWTTSHPQVRMLRRLARRMAPGANAVGIALSIFDGGRALVDRDFLAAATIGIAISLTVLGTLLVYFRMGGIYAALLMIAASLVYIVYETLRDGPLGELYRNGPFTARAFNELNADQGSDAPAYLWVRQYAERGPMVFGRSRQERWSSWWRINKDISEAIFAPPIRVEVDYRRFSWVGPNRISDISVDIVLPGFDWRAGDGVELRYLLRNNKGKVTEIFDVTPQLTRCEIINQRAVNDSGDGLQLSMGFCDLELPTHAMSLMVLISVNGLVGSFPVSHSDGTPRYLVVAVRAIEWRHIRSYRVFTASIEEVLDGDLVFGL
ncbi:PAAR-like domain-containing protein [Halorhodospira halochloris]|uniref:PAAR-like domain-containing protein n=1 Tax=Halorhodospira halochloris TaxID=1052 RepID=UPI001EE8022D|nr:PAAR-like domain-containing protein [Halorhodospira halochloris]MCG5548558.1 DUF4150 domain-containing protein [Halorhodospira halochloris]